MDELLEVSKKQLMYQKITSGCLVILILLLLAGGGLMAGYMNRMTGAMEDAVQKIAEIDVESINETISGTQDMMESVQEFSDAVDDVTSKVQEFNSWFSGIFGGNGN